eukprot:1154670-Pelagomonas_calceolata.AAC.2
MQLGDLVLCIPSLIAEQGTVMKKPEEECNFNFIHIRLRNGALPCSCVILLTAVRGPGASPGSNSG